MSKSAPNTTLDTLLDEIATGTSIIVCSSEPTTYTEATSTYALADVTVTAGDGNGDFTISDHATSGRKLVTTAQTSVLIDTSGTALHIAICDVGNTELLYVTTCTSQALTANASNTVTIPAMTIQVKDPV